MDKISIVTSLYRSAPYIVEFHSRYREVAERLGVSFEFIFVDDGSPDDANSVAQELIGKFSNIILVTLSRNYGQHAGMFAAMAHASGDYIFATDCDLEESPDNLEIFYKKIKADSSTDVFYGVWKERSGGILSKIAGGIFYTMLDWFSDVKVPRNQSWQRLMTKRYVDALLQYKEVETLPAGLMVLAGFKQLPVEISKTYKGSSSYSTRKLILLAVNSFTSFSSKPLIFVALIGFFITAIAFSLLIYTFLRKIFSVDFQAGWVSIIGSIWCIGGLTLASIGIVGIYLSKVFNQVKGRPLYVIKEISKSSGN